MNKFKITLSAFFLISGFLCQAQYPTDYFRSPLDIPLLLSGSFGELRSNHFHTGLDFKTQQKEGLPVYAAADGYISRIKISAYGYGKAIYIDHPNGYTTVYGHLSKGNGAIESFIKEIHYKEQSFEIEMFPTPDQLRVKKGDVIAFSGNTGGSGGPHLHFEFRDTKSEKIINPMLFGFNILVADTKKPTINTLMVYPVGENSSVNRSRRPLMVNLVQQPDGNYIADKVLASGKIGFGISAYDNFDFTYNKNGIFKAQSFCNGSPNFGYQFDNFAFSESRYINALLDYSRFKRTGMRIQKLFAVTPYPLSIIKTNAENGLLNVVPNLTSICKIEVSDFHNNKISVDIPVEYSDLPPTVLPEETKKTNYFLKAQNDNSYRKDNISVFIPANTFYEDFYLDFEVKDNVLYLHDNSIPVHGNFTVTFEGITVSEAEKEKMFIASIDGKKKSYNHTIRKENTFTTYTKNLGQFILEKDTIAPKITPANFKEGKWFSKQKSIEFTISDNLSGLKEYKAYLNGKWVLFEYDYKTRKITHDFDDVYLADGRNDLKMVVTDNVGNSVIFETHFFRKKL